MKIKLFIASVMTGIISIVVYKVINDINPSLTEDEIKEQLEKINNRELQMVNVS